MQCFLFIALVTGKHTLVVESTELGGSAALATYTIQLEVIDSTEPETEGFSDSTQSATIPHLQEIVASSAVLVLILILFFSKMRSKRLEKQRLLHYNKCKWVNLLMHRLIFDRFLSIQMNRIGIEIDLLG